jgi:hypothetical protein
MPPLLSIIDYLKRKTIMRQQNNILEPTNIERAEWARNALAVFTAETCSGDHPDVMHPDDLESAIGDLICDLLHLARFHPRIDAATIHAHALKMFEVELAEEENSNRSAKPPVDLLDALLNIKRLAGKSGDHESDPFALLDLIADEARAAIQQAT